MRKRHQDLNLGWRTLDRSPAFTFVAPATRTLQLDGRPYTVIDVLPKGPAFDRS